MIELMTVANHPLIVKKTCWADEKATMAFAQTLAQHRAIVTALITLHGELGAGKTTFARHLLHALGVTGRVKSPTYAVVEAYTVEKPAAGAAALSVWHCDFYRFSAPDEWEDAGFRDIFASPGLKLVEWPDKAGRYLPQADLSIAIESLADQTRQVTVSAHTPAGLALAQSLT